MAANEMEHALTEARFAFESELLLSLSGFHLTGVAGEAETGKSTLVRHALSRSTDFVPVVLNLDSTYSTNRLVWQWARALARATMESVAVSHVVGLPSSAWPGKTRSEIVLFEERFGPVVAGLLQAPHPEPGQGAAANVEPLIEATVGLSAEKSALLVIDHLEAPSLTPRHPVDVKDLLWQVRSVSQHAVDLRVLLVGRSPLAMDLAAGPESAYYGDGNWLRLGVPSAASFAAASGLDAEIVQEVLGYTGGHVPSTLMLLRRAKASRSVHAAASTIASEHATLADRALQHASSIHRLGGHLMCAVASGEGPYSATPDASSKEISTAMKHLHRAGLISRPDERRAEWAITDPRVAWAINGGPTSEPRSRSFV